MEPCPSIGATTRIVAPLMACRVRRDQTSDKATVRRSPHPDTTQLRVKLCCPSRFRISRQLASKVGDHVPEPRRPAPGGREGLAACVRDVSAARARLDAARHTGARSWEQHPLRAELLAALELYAAAITELGAPVPYRLRGEIELYRRLGNRG